MLINIIFVVFALIVLFWQVSLIIAVLSGAPTVYAKGKAIKKALESVGVKKNQLVVDLGCGNARSLIIAAKLFGAKGIGVEISPFYYLLAKINVLINGESKNIQIKFGNLRSSKKDVHRADVVFLYLLDTLINKLEPWIFNELKENAKIVALAFPFQDHKAEIIDGQPKIYIYSQ